MPTKKELEELNENIDVIVIGSGVGGLATANILSRFGYKVVVFEQHYTVGGSTHVYKTKDFEFDVGVHYVGSHLDCWRSGCRLLFDWLSDGQLHWAPLNEIYDVACNSKTKERIEFVGNSKTNRKAILQHFGPDLDFALARYYHKCHQARLVAYAAFVMKLMPAVVARIAWKLGFGCLYTHFCLGTTYQVMKESCGLPDNVIGALTYSYGDYGTPPTKSPFFMQAFMENHYNGGAFFPKGGSSSIAKTLVAAILRRGGKVYAGAPVDKILTARTRLGTTQATGVVVKGVEIRSRKGVISDCGFTKTFETVGNSIPLVDPVVGSRQLALLHQDGVQSDFSKSPAFLYLFVGMDATDKELGLVGQNIWQCSDWDHSKAFEQYFSCSCIGEAMKQTPPLVFLSMESAKDPDFHKRHEGKSTVTIIAWTDAQWFERYKDTQHKNRPASYLHIKEELTQCLLDVLYFHFPLTKGRVVFSELGTPLSTNKYLGRTQGEIYNLDHNETRFKTLNAHLALHPQTRIAGLYLTGQDVLAVSIEGAVLSGCFTAGRVSWIAWFMAIPVALICLPWAIT
jgi:all-trans-retinol 13,14-reductase